MWKKYGRYYADWTENGKRKRRSFPTKAAAIRFQNKQRKFAAAKKAHAPRTSSPSAKRGAGQVAAAATTK
jgi:hypothetical protein